EEGTSMANLTRFNPFNEALSLREAMDRLFEDSYISPRVAGHLGGRGVVANLYETPDNFILQIPMPGVKPEDVEITAQQDTLSLKWETKAQVPEGATVHWLGFGDGQFQQAFTLPASINAARADTRTTDGVLTHTMPITETATP